MNTKELFNINDYKNNDYKNMDIDFINFIEAFLFYLNENRNFN